MAGKNEGSSEPAIGPSLTAEQQDLAAGQLPGDRVSLASDGKQWWLHDLCARTAPVSVLLTLFGLWWRLG
jgi:hypothetical protein